MGALAYLLLPVSGALAYFGGHSARTRVHGMQAVILGLLWPLALYGASSVGPAVTKIVFLFGALLWLTLMVAAVVGRDLVLPALRRLVKEEEPGD